MKTKSLKILAPLRLDRKDFERLNFEGAEYKQVRPRSRAFEEFGCVKKLNPPAA